MDAKALAAEAKAKALADLKKAEEMERAAAEMERVAAQFGWKVNISVDANVVIAEAQKTAAAEPLPASTTNLVTKRGGKAPDPNSTTSRSKAEGVKIVRELNRPVPLGEMAKRLAERGVVLGGKDPNQALSANLGKCAELRPTPRGWWLKGVQMPRENAKTVGGGERLPGLN